jgi:hypothetical protein
MADPHVALDGIPKHPGGGLDPHRFFEGLIQERELAALVGSPEGPSGSEQSTEEREAQRQETEQAGHGVGALTVLVVRP